MAKKSFVKDHDSIVAVLFASRVAVALLPLARASGISPNAITCASFALVLVAAGLLADGGWGGTVAVLVLAGFVLDCLDGTLARATERSSDFGRWFDSITDLVKVYALVWALAVRAASETNSAAVPALAGIALLGYLLCELHVQISRQLPQRSEADYEEVAAPWRARLRFFGQKIDLAFAIGEVMATIAVTAALDRPAVGLAILAVAMPIQFASYSIRFWRYRYATPR